MFKFGATDKQTARSNIMAAHKRIVINPDIMFGKPVIKNTRITVEQILRKLASGMLIAEILEDHPRITKEDVLAAQAFAADLLADEELAFG